MVEVKVNFEIIKIQPDDVGNLECNLCDRSCQSVDEVWWDSETDNTILSLCNECMLKHSEGGS